MYIQDRSIWSVNKRCWQKLWISISFGVENWIITRQYTTCHVYSFMKSSQSAVLSIHQMSCWKRSKVIQKHGWRFVTGHFGYAILYRKFVALLNSTRWNKYENTRNGEKAFTLPNEAWVGCHSESDKENWFLRVVSGVYFMSNFAFETLECVCNEVPQHVTGGIWFGKYSHYGPLTRYTKLRVVHAPGMLGSFFFRHRLLRKPLVSDSGMHHGTCVANLQWQGKRSRHSRACATRNFKYLSMGPMDSDSDGIYSTWMDTELQTYTVRFANVHT